jgi:hypothetical protein
MTAAELRQAQQRLRHAEIVERRSKTLRAIGIGIGTFLVLASLAIALIVGPIIFPPM